MSAERQSHLRSRPESRSVAPRPKRGSGATTAEHRVSEMLEGVRAKGLKLTPQRIAIVRAIAGDPSHPTAQEIFDRLQSSMPTMSFATVYNTLDALANAGLCGSLSLSPGPARFDPNMDPHHHAVCDGCGLVRDVERSFLEGATGPVPAPAQRSGPRGRTPIEGFELRAIEHIYRGLCARCKALDGRRAHDARSAESPSRDDKRTSSVTPRGAR